MKETAVLREWRGRTRAAQLEEYARYVEETGIRAYLRTPGNRGALILTRTQGEVGHIVTLSLWDSMKSIEAFSGTQVDQARYFARDAEYLLEFEPTVEHYRADVYRPREPLTIRERG
jgi:heme-degrading monooxygenase HmoA